MSQPLQTIGAKLPLGVLVLTARPDKGRKAGDIKLMISLRIELDILRGGQQEWLAGRHSGVLVAEGAAQAEQGLAKVMGSAFVGEIGWRPSCPTFPRP